MARFKIEAKEIQAMYGIKSNPASLLILIKCLVVKTTKTIRTKILIYASNGL